MKRPFDPTVHEDGSIEAVCYGCGEPLLLYVGDGLDLIVIDDEVAGVSCTRCRSLVEKIKTLKCERCGGDRFPEILQCVAAVEDINDVCRGDWRILAGAIKVCPDCFNDQTNGGT
jgi:hypothetical protein